MKTDYLFLKSEVEQEDFDFALVRSGVINTAEYQEMASAFE